MGSDLNIGKLINKTVIPPEYPKDKVADNPYDVKKAKPKAPINFAGRNSEGDHIRYTFNPDRGFLEVCNNEEKFCGVMEDTDKDGKFDIGTIYSLDESLRKDKIKSQEKPDENENDVETVAKSILVELQQQNKKYHPPKVNIKGKIGKFKQSYTMGDCGLLGSTLGLAFSSEGAKIIKDSIKKDKNGDVHMELKGINETFDVSPEEIVYARGRLSRGSDDMRAIELALEKEGIKSAKRRLKLSKMYAGMLDEDSIKQELKKTIEGYSPRGVFLRLTKGRVDGTLGYNWELKEDPDDPFQPPVWEHVDPSKDPSIAEEAKKERQKTQKFLDEKMRYPDKIALSASIIVDINRPNAHEVGVKKVDEKNVVYVNPWDTSKEIKVSREEFIRNYYSMTVCDLEPRRTKEEDNFAR